MSGLGTMEQDDICENFAKQGEKEMRKREQMTETLEEYDGVGKITAQKKILEQFRVEIVDAIFSTIREETANSVVFMENADYLNAKLTETKIEGLHKALGIVLAASTVEVKEE